MSEIIDAAKALLTGLAVIAGICAAISAFMVWAIASCHWRPKPKKKGRRK